MQTFEQIQAQIVDLQKQADVMRKQAVTAAIKEVKRLINLYSLVAADLGLGAKAAVVKKTATAKPVKAKANKTAKKSSGDKRGTVAPKYRDSDSAKTWTGRGKQPTWLAAKIAAGASKDSFLIQ